MLSIKGLRHYLLTIIDYFSRYILACAIVKTVTQRKVKDLLAIAYISQGIVLDTDGSGICQYGLWYQEADKGA